MARILPVEDEDAVRSLLTVLSKHGHDVLAFCDGEPALEALLSEDVDIILTDLLMPTPGEEVVRLARLRGFKGPVIIMSGLNPASCDVIEADKVLKKPFALRELDELVGTLSA